MSIHFYSKLSCNLLDWNFERASTLNGLALSMSHVIDKLKFVGEIEYLFNTQFLFVFTQMMTATIIIGIILIIPIYAGPRIAILE